MPESHCVGKRVHPCMSSSLRKIDQNFALIIALCGAAIGWLYLGDMPILDVFNHLRDQVMSGLFPVPLWMVLKSPEWLKGVKAPVTVGTGILVSLLILIRPLSKFLGEGT
jgi:hypothetical protein